MSAPSADTLDREAAHLAALPTGPWTYLDLGEVIDANSDVVVEVYYAANQEQTDAVGNLIAAAPAMLQALIDARETLRQICEGQHPDNVCCHNLRAVEAAIALATDQ